LTRHLAGQLAISFAHTSDLLFATGFWIDINGRSPYDVLARAFGVQNSFPAGAFQHLTNALKSSVCLWWPQINRRTHCNTWYSHRNGRYCHWVGEQGATESKEGVQKAQIEKGHPPISLTTVPLGF